MMNDESRDTLIFNYLLKIKTRFTFTQLLNELKIKNFASFLCVNFYFNFIGNYLALCVLCENLCVLCG